MAGKLNFRVPMVRKQIVSDGVELFEGANVTPKTLVMLVDRFVDLQGDVHMGLTDDDLCEIKVSILYRLRCCTDKDQSLHVADLPHNVFNLEHH